MGVGHSLNTGQMLRILLFVAFSMSLLFLLQFVHFSVRFDAEQATSVIDMLRQQGKVKATRGRVAAPHNMRGSDGAGATGAVGAAGAGAAQANPYSSSTHSFYSRAREAFTGHSENIAHAQAHEREGQPLATEEVGSSRGGLGSSGSSSSSSSGNSKIGFSLPGAEQHPILRMSDAQLRASPVSELMALYGEADGGGSCAADFGNELVQRWREKRRISCLPSTQSSVQVTVLEAEDALGGARGGPRQSSLSSGSLGSSVDCYLVKQTRHHGPGDNLCHMKNVAVDLALFSRDEATRPVVQEYVATRHNKQPYVAFPSGFVQGDCKPDPSQWTKALMPGWNADLTVGAFASVSAEDSASVCDEWVEHKVLVTQRDTFANFFHDSEDFFNAFLAMAVLQWAPGETQVLLTDLYPEGPFWDMWSRVFSQGTPQAAALTAWDLRQRFGKTAPGKRVCFRDLAVGIYGPASPVTVASWDTPCKRTALVRAYSDFVLRGLGLQEQSHYAQAAPSDVVRVTYMSRRPSKEWPERKYCDSERSFFLCSLWEHFGERRLGRMIKNDKEVVAALKGMEKEIFQQGGRSVRVEVRDVDYNVLSFEQQISTDLQTDIMIGPHGAGLMHNIFMRDRALLIELFVDNSQVNRHFHNLAWWFGRNYKGLSISNPIKIPQLLKLVRGGIGEIDFSQY